MAIIKEVVVKSYKGEIVMLNYPSQLVNIFRSRQGYFIGDAITGDIIVSNISSWDEAVRRAQEIERKEETTDVESFLIRIEKRPIEYESSYIDELREETRRRESSKTKKQDSGITPKFAVGDVLAGDTKWTYVGGSPTYNIYRSSKTGKYSIAERDSGKSEKTVAQHLSSKKGKFGLSDLDRKILELENKSGEQIVFQESFGDIEIKGEPFEKVLYIDEVRKGMVDPATKVIVPSKEMTTLQEKAIRRIEDEIRSRGLKDPRTGERTYLTPEEADTWIQRFTSRSEESKMSPSRKAQEEGRRYPDIE